jgi:hypothetical protein
MNAFDCGVFVIKMADRAAVGDPVDRGWLDEEFDGKYYRYRIAIECINSYVRLKEDEVDASD